MPENLGNTQNSENHNSRIVKTTNQELPESQFKNGENHNSGIVKTTNQEFPESQFKNDENHTSRIVEITTQEVPNHNLIILILIILILMRLILSNPIYLHLQVKCALWEKM